MPVHRKAHLVQITQPDLDREQHGQCVSGLARIARGGEPLYPAVEMTR